MPLRFLKKIYLTTLSTAKLYNFKLKAKIQFKKLYEKFIINKNKIINTPIKEIFNQNFNNNY